MGSTPRRIAAVLPGSTGPFAVLVGAFCLVRVAEAAEVAPGWVTGYADDFLCLPLVLGIALVAHRLGGRPARWSLPVSHGLLAVGIFAIFFEMILPQAGFMAVGDPLDPLLYLAGFLVFQFGFNSTGTEAAPSCDSADAPLSA